MPFPVEAETEEVYEEGRSILGSLITRLIAIVQQIVRWVTAIATRIVEYAAEHPLAITLLIANICIWVS
jgi:hypothetical protein